MQLSRDELLKAYRQMRTIREFEDTVHEEFSAGNIPGFVHLYAGEEASGVGFCLHLNDEDRIASTHRGHGHCIAKGCDVKGMMAEIFGRKDGLCGGKGGSMHIADLSKGMLGANGIVGGGPPLICGAALSAKTLKTGGVAIAFVGDGGSNQGTTAESMNLAKAWNLPAIFVPAGPMTSGLPNDEKSRVRQRYAVGEATREELLEAEAQSYHGPGTCTFYGTANSNQMLMEIMGLHLPGSSFINPDNPLRDALTAQDPVLVLRVGVEQDHLDLVAVAGVDQPGRVGHGDAVAQGQTAAGEHEAGVPRRNGHGQPGRHQRPPAAGGDDRVLSGQEVEPGVTRPCVRREGQVRVEEYYGHTQHGPRLRGRGR